MRPRIDQELELLRRHFEGVEHTEAGGDDWFLLPRYEAPPGTRLGEEPVREIPLAFVVVATYPGAPPYGFLAPAAINFNGAKPVKNVGGPPKPPPFSGGWIHFSWTTDGGTWAPTATVEGGSNLLAWCRGFRERLEQGP